MKLTLRLLTFLGLISFFATHSSHAAVLYVYNGFANNYIPSNQEFRNTDGTDFTSGSSRSYSESTAFSPLISPNYSGPSFLGGISVITGSGGITHSETGIFNALDIDRSASTELADGLRLGFGTNSTAALLVMAEMGIGMDWTSGSDVWSWRGSRNGGAGNTGNVRPVVKIGSQYYVSDYSEGISNSISTLSFNLSELTTWSLYDPFTGLGYASSSPGSLVLEDISHAGYLMTIARTTTANDLRVGSFSISGIANVVPEPSRVVMSIASLGFILLRRRRA